MYGIGNPTTDSYGRRCLMARRLVERGVRFVQLFIENQIWDNHNRLATTLKDACVQTDQPIAALLQDLSQRGLMDDTLVLWGGEFGRLPIAQLRSSTDDKVAGRDHNKNAFTLWMAGAGVKPGIAYGATDELGLLAVENRVSVQDWHATILHLLGIDYQRLSFDAHGLKEKLTGVFETHIVKEILS
jgi:arylsulfatase A-like enzyme